MNPWFVNLTPRPMATGRLVCVPHAGGGPSAFMGWRSLIPEHIELWAIRLPGHEGRFNEPPGTDLCAAAASAAEALAGLMNIPYALFGHSLGAWLGLETARRLRTIGREPAAFIASGRAAPSTAANVENIAHLPDQKFLIEVQSRYDGIPQSVLASAEIIDAILPSLRADIAMLEGYEYREAAPLACPIHVFTGTDDPNTTPIEQLDAWARETTGGLSVREFPGGHFYIETARNDVMVALNGVIDAMR